MSKSIDSFNCRKTLKVGDAEYVYFSLAEAEKNGLSGISRLPFSMKVLLENLLRNEDGRSVTKADLEAVSNWLEDRGTTGVCPSSCSPPTTRPRPSSGSWTR